MPNKHCKRSPRRDETLFFGKYRGNGRQGADGGRSRQVAGFCPRCTRERICGGMAVCPFAGPSHGFVAIPEEGDGVWIEFEAGNPAQPIWVGCWWGSGDMPSPGDVKVRSWVTTGGLAIVLDDDQNQISLQHPDGPSITLSSDGITLSTDSATVTLDARRNQPPRQYAGEVNNATRPHDRKPGAVHARRAGAAPHGQLLSCSPAEARPA